MLFHAYTKYLCGKHAQKSMRIIASVNHRFLLKKIFKRNNKIVDKTNI